VKVFVALAAFFVAAPWAAGTSNIAEGESSSVYCVKLVGDEDGSYIELSQKAANASVQGEQCYEWWYTQDGSPSAYSALQEFFQAEYPPAAVRLTSDLYFGGYDGSQCISGANAYHPFEFGVEQERILLTSSLTSPFTIHGVCYQGGASEASFGGMLFSTIQNIKFEDLHLESLTSAGLFSYAVGSAEAVKISITNSVVRAPVAGTLAGVIESILVSEFNGNSVTVNAIPGLDQGESFTVNEVNIGSLVGVCSALSMGSVKLSDVYVIYQPMPGESYLDSSLPDGNAYVGGIAGSVAGIDNNDMDRSASLFEVGLENMVITDYAEGDGANYVGGLIGKFDGTWLSVMRTYTIGDILCKSESCVQGYGAGLITFPEQPSVEVRANYHYSENEQERAQAFAGMVVGHYLTEYADAGVTGAPDTVITDEFNRAGYIPNYTEEYVDDETVFVKDDVTVATGNYRNAIGDIAATDNFNSEDYTFEDLAAGTLQNGVLEGQYMRSARFIEILDNVPGVLTSGDVSWKFDDAQKTPYLDIGTESGDSGENYVQPAEVYFSFDCVNYGNCLTEDELLALEPFENNREDPDGYTYKFVVGSDGTIENTEWLDFVFNLTLENPDRERVYWYTSYNQKFSKYNVYDANTYYYLMKGEPEEDDSEDVDIAESNSYVFFGKGIDFDRTIVEIFSYDGESVEEIGDMRDMMSYSGGSQPIEMKTGSVMRIVAMNPVTTDGREFKGWVLRAAIAPSTNVDVLREIAFDGVDIPVDEDGYANLSEYSEQIGERFEESILGECMVLKQENPGIGLDSLQKLAEVCSRKSAEIEKAYESAVFVMAIFPKGFEEENGIFDIPDHHDQQRDTVLAEVEYPALFQSGNGIQLAVKTDEFVYEEIAPFVSVRLEDLGGEPLQDTLFEFTDGEWPETFTWEKYPLAPGRYLLTAKIYDGKNQNPDVRQWDFEVKAQIADGCSDCWYMVSLSNVVLDKVNPSDVNVLYWWNEQSVNGKYWQYEEIERVSDVDRTRGYWYNSIEGLPLELDGESLDDDVVVWEIDSVYSGWNMVRNPFGWYIDVSDLKRQGYAFYRWDPEQGNYVQPHYIKPYEAFWIKTKRYEVIDLPSTPAFVDMVDADGNTVPRLSLQKKQVLAKAAGSEDWNVQISLFDTKGKADTWNVLGVGNDAASLDEPPAGMGDHVNLTIVDAGRRLAKSVKEENRDAAYEWNVEISATSARMGYLKVEGVDALRVYGLRAFLTVDGVTTELRDDGKVQVSLSTTPKTATLRIASAARKVVASTLQGLRAHDLGSTLQVGFDVGEGLAGARARVDLVDMKGHVVNAASFKAEAGRNEISLERPERGLYVLRAVVGHEVAIQKILLH
jgi:hypothetical protein